MSSKTVSPTRRVRGTTRSEAAALESKVSTAERKQLRLRAASSAGVASSLMPSARDVSGKLATPRSTGFDPASKPKQSVLVTRQAPPASAPDAAPSLDTARKAFHANQRTHFDLSVPSGVSARESMRSRHRREKAAMYKPHIPSATTIGRKARSSNVHIGGDSLTAGRMPQKATVKPVAYDPYIPTRAEIRARMTTDSVGPERGPAASATRPATASIVRSRDRAKAEAREAYALRGPKVSTARQIGARQRQASTLASFDKSWGGGAPDTRRPRSAVSKPSAAPVRSVPAAMPATARRATAMRSSFSLTDM